MLVRLVQHRLVLESGQLALYLQPILSEKATVVSLLVGAQLEVALTELYDDENGEWMKIEVQLNLEELNRR